MKSVMLVKAKKMSVGTIRKYGQSFYRKTASRGWQRVPTKEGRKLYEKQKAKTPTKQPTRTKKIPTRMNVSNVTQQYIDKLKKIKIMNESGKKVYIKLVKRAIKNKDRKLLDKYLGEIDSWIKRDKKLKEGKNKKMDWRAVK